MFPTPFLKVLPQYEQWQKQFVKISSCGTTSSVSAQGLKELGVLFADHGWTHDSFYVAHLRHDAAKLS